MKVLHSRFHLNIKDWVVVAVLYIIVGVADAVPGHHSLLDPTNPAINFPLRVWFPFSFVSSFLC
jgi:hypothetical protein